jgi:gamma-butyrobetaine dioxygenase
MADVVASAMVGVTAGLGQPAAELTLNGDGAVRRFPAIWLRDNCPCPQCKDPHSGQKLFGITDLPENIAIGSVTDDGATVSVLFEPDGHRGVFTRAWLMRHGSDGYGVDPRTEDAKVLWTAADVDLDATTGSWPDLVADPTHRERCLDALVRLGFVFLREVPARAGAVLDVAGEFGFVRETNYGRLFDVRITDAATNLAFTGLPITPHTDNPYRDPVPTVQLLHCLVNQADGGDSGLVDGFSAASFLRDTEPEAFAILARTPVTFRYQDSSVDLSASAPLIVLDPRGRIRAVRYNDRSMQPLPLRCAEAVAFYAAYRLFSRALRRPTAQLNLRLSAGDCLVFDNTRVLHARTGFTAVGGRHLQGCYADIDAVESQLRVLRRGGAGDAQ